MRKFCILIALFFLLTGCQTNNTADNPGGSISKIEVIQWETNELSSTITDEEYIAKLTQALNTAKTVSTATVSFRSPDYKVLIIQNEKTIHELGYYKNALKYRGIEGRYINLNLYDEKMYGVTLELPIN